MSIPYSNAGRTVNIHKIKGMNYHELKTNELCTKNADGVMEGTNVFATSGNLTTTGAISGGATTVTSLNTSSGAITGGAVTATSVTSTGEVLCSSLNCAKGSWNGTIRFCGVNNYTNNNRIYGFQSGDHWYQDYYVRGGHTFRIYRNPWNSFCQAYGAMYATSHPTSSDDRLKHNEVDVSNALSTIRKLNAQKYQKTDEPKDADFNGELTENYIEETGFIAQEVMKIPELTYCVTDGQTSSGKDIYYLNYNDIFVVNVQAVKELDAIVQSQQTEIDSLKARLTALENRN